MPEIIHQFPWLELTPDKNATTAPEPSTERFGWLEGLSPSTSLTWASQDELTDPELAALEEWTRADYVPRLRREMQEALGRVVSGRYRPPIIITGTPVNTKYQRLDGWQS